MKTTAFLSLKICSFVTLIGFAFPATARPLDATGTCPQNAVMKIATTPFAGEAKALLNIPKFAELHGIATAQQDKAIQTLHWKSGYNREFQSGNQKIIVATICNPVDCENHRDYIAFDPTKSFYGGSFYEGRHVREYGITETIPVYDDSLDPAIICAQNLDWQQGKTK